MHGRKNIKKNVVWHLLQATTINTLSKHAHENDQVALQKNF